MKSPIFIIGTGRSGTTWLGRIIQSHPNVSATIESPKIFKLSTELALNSDNRKFSFWKLVLLYKWQIIISYPNHYLDKSHPNIWFADRLVKCFPNARFLGIERNPYATVSSMILHKGVSSWHDRWKEFQIPNKFLGISYEDAKIYDQLPLAVKCAMRWKSHHERMNELREILGKSLLIISYERLVKNTKGTLDIICDFLQLSSPIPLPNVKESTLEKWKKNLSQNQIEQIMEVIGHSPEEYEI
jgi:hypothetical protein